jgi:glyoxylase-like metal-dependent hydrolase (beta-lactamase superfamily II)
VVETSDGLALIDTGLDKEAGPLCQQMEALGLDWKRLRAILLTHVHGDHSGGAEYLRAATGAKVYAGQADAAVLRAGQPREAFFSAFPVPAEVVPTPTTVDVELSGDQEFMVGDARFRALNAPGHTPGSVCYLMERGGRRALFTGDVLMSLSPAATSRSPLKRPLGTYTAYRAPRYRGDAAAFLASLRKLRALPVPDLVLPGHPRNDPEPMSPHLTPERWQELLDPGIREMEHLLARYERDGAAFLDGVPKRLLPDLYYLGDFKGVAVYGFFAAEKFFLVNAPGEQGLAGHLDDRLRQLGVGGASPVAVLLTSGEPEASAGLAQLVEKYHCQAVASSAWTDVTRASPTRTDILAPEDLAGKDWFPVRVIPLSGRGGGSVAYLLPRAGKSVLFSGPVPVKVAHAAPPGAAREAARVIGDPIEYLSTLRRLGELRPDLWLPASPVEGQNANLYGDEWLSVLAENKNLLR